MNAAQWRKLGYKTIFRGDMVYLYRPLSGVTIRTAINHGDWMTHDDVNKPPWEKNVPPLPDFEETARKCYCGDFLCDFCAGRRKP